MLTEQGKIEGQDFTIPVAIFVNPQLSPMNENRKTTEHFTSSLKVKRQLQAKNARNHHQHGHYVAQQKKNWRYHGCNLQKLIESAGINMGDEDDYILPWYSAVKFIGQDDKASIPIGRHVPIVSTAHSTV